MASGAISDVFGASGMPGGAASRGVRGVLSWPAQAPVSDVANSITEQALQPGDVPIETTLLHFVFAVLGWHFCCCF